MSLNLNKQSVGQALVKLITIIIVIMLILYYYYSASADHAVAPVNSLQQFRVMTREAGRAEFAVVITSPSGGSVTAHVVPVADGYVVNFTPTEVGEYRLSVTLGGEQAGRQYRMTCTRVSDPSKVTARGPGLAGGPVNRPAEFTIDTKRAGQGGLGVTVEGPCEAAINCRDNGDGTCSVAYMPVEAGHYVINITFDDHPIPGSPFNALVGGRAAGDPPRPPNNVKASGNGLLANGKRRRRSECSERVLPCVRDMLCVFRACSPRVCPCSRVLCGFMVLICDRFSDLT